MSAPDTNLERQKNRHKTMAWGIWVGLSFAAVVAIGLAIASFGYGVDLAAWFTNNVPSVDG